MTAYRAAHIWTGDSQSNRGGLMVNGIIDVQDGLIADVRESGSFDVDLGNVIVLPGLINSHTHLEFSDLKAPLEPRDNFPEWIRAVINYRMQRPRPVESPKRCKTESNEPRPVESRMRCKTGSNEHSPVVKEILTGLQASLSTGVTTLGEIATTDWRNELTNDSSFHAPDVVMFREYFGLADEMLSDLLEDAKSFLSATPTAQVQAALSPHAPYSVHPKLFDGLCLLAEKHQVPLAFHLAESKTELELLDSATGTMVDFLTERGVWRPGLIPSQTCPLDYLKRMASLPRGLVVHGNYLTTEEIDFIAQHPNLSVVYCPRTHSAMQPNPHPWKTMISAGVNVALGTDSLASNPDLSIWNELKFLQRQHPDLSPFDLLPLATTHGAKALGLSDVGKIAVGMQADLCVVSHQSDQDFSIDLLLDKHSEVTATMQHGAWTC